MVTMELSIVIPAYNETARLGKTLDAICAWLNTSSLTAEIIISDDGSTDDTRALIASYMQHDARIRLIGDTTNRGKGYAVRQGMLMAQGTQMLFTDADLSTPMEDYHTLAEALQQADVAIGSRDLPESNVEVSQRWYREALGKLFNKVVQRFSVRGIHDTQCGFKLFRAAAARDIFRACHINGFAFDVEALYLARKLGYRIAEVPVTWRNDPLSKVHPLRDGFAMLVDMWRIRRLH